MNYEEMTKYVDRIDYIKGINYYEGYIEFLNQEKLDNTVINKFLVESERTSKKYKCNIETVINTRNITHVSCTCPQFKDTHSCKHLAACLYNYYDQIFYKEITDEYRNLVTKKLFELLSKVNKKTERKVRKEVVIEVYLEGNNSDSNREDVLDLSLKIGTDKLYQCKGNKLSNFLDAVSGNEAFSFGKFFEYNPDTCYFSEENKKIINYLSLLDEHKDRYYYSSREVLKGSSTIKGFLELLKGRTFYLNSKKITNIENSFPITSKLIKNDDLYKLDFSFPDDLYFITNDLEFLQIENTLYRLNQNERNLLLSIMINDIDQLVFKDEDKNDFSNNILPLVKNNIEIDDKIDEFNICKNISSKLYFDLYQSKVICTPIFLYDNLEVNYFADDNSVLRDREYENEVISDLYNCNFSIENKKLLLSDLEHIGSFIENDLEKLAEKYQVYTSEKLKKIKVIKKSSVKSTFSIGQDNIMSYSFDLGDIKDEDIVNVLEALNDKKKYYRLKSGDIVNLSDNKDLEELNDLVKDMNIAKNDLINGGGEIPKYRAIYLDSLKDDKYHIIETNNLFDKLITKFNMYKNSKVKLSEKEKELLRDYQKDGVKWLYNIDKTGFGGILADEMGLGKSIQTIYYIKELLKENKDYKILIVSPTSLSYNWANEFDKFEPSMKKVVMLGNRSIRRCKFEEIEDINILITTYGLLREDKEYYDKINFKTIIIDEAQNIKNVNTAITKAVKSIKADTKIALTGTPIENSIDELWSIFDFIMPGFLPELVFFDKKYKIKEFDDEANKKIGELNKLVSPFILRRRKRDVIKDLPDKIENNIYVELTKEQKKIYLAELDRVNKAMNDIIATGGVSKARFLILQLLTKLRQICIDPKIIFKDYKGSSGKMEEFVKVVSETVENGHKILVFTSFKEGLKLAKGYLDNKGITSYIIDGSVSAKKRLELVDKFNKDDTNVFFIMLKAGGTGLNLTSADVVIHLDLWWNPQAENQATDRAHRIGQKKVVEVIKFITKGTIEEKILDLQNKKKVLSDKLIDENESKMAFSKLTEKDIRNLLAYEEESM